MKEKYIYKDGKINAVDYNIIGIDISYEYQDNIGEILKTENIIEFLEKNKNVIKRDIRELCNSIKRNNKKMDLLEKILVINSIVSALFLVLNPIIFISFYVLTLGICLVYLSVFSSINNKYIKIINGNRLELKELEKELVKNKKYLIKLYKNKAITEEKIKGIENKVNFVRYREYLKELRKYLKMHFYIGSNEKEFEKYYKDGSIDKKLEKEYDNDEIKLIKKYFDNKKN